MLGLLIALDTVREVFSGEPLILQVLLLPESLAGISCVDLVPAEPAAFTW